MDQADPSTHMMSHQHPILPTTCYMMVEANAATLILCETVLRNARHRFNWYLIILLLRRTIPQTPGLISPAGMPLSQGP